MFVPYLSLTIKLNIFAKKVQAIFKKKILSLYYSNSGIQYTITPCIMTYYNAHLDMLHFFLNVFQKKKKKRDKTLIILIK